MTRRWFGRKLMALVAAALLVTAYSPPSHAATRTHKKVYTIYLSNNFLGNDWRVLMENLAKVLIHKPPLAGRVNLKIVNTAQNTPTDQIQSLNSIIAAKPDAILIDASSPDALNSTIKRACDRGIPVLSFDQVVTAPCAWKLHVDSAEEGRAFANWLGLTLHGKGKIFVDIGITGTPIAQLFNNAYNQIFPKYRRIKIVCRYASQAALGPEEQGVSNCLAANPKVSGITSLGYGTGAMKVLKQAGHRPVPIAMASFNASMLACANRKQPCFLASDPAWMSGFAIKTAVEILDGKRSRKARELLVPIPYFQNNNVHVPGLSTKPEKIVIGKNAFPKLPGQLFLPFSPPWTKVTPHEAQTGNP